MRVKTQRVKIFRKLLRRKQSSAKISKISRNTLKSSKNDILYLLRNLLKYLLRTFFSSAKFSEVFALLRFYPLDLSENPELFCNGDLGLNVVGLGFQFASGQMGLLELAQRLLAESRT